MWWSAAVEKDFPLKVDAILAGHVQMMNMQDLASAFQLLCDALNTLRLIAKL